MVDFLDDGKRGAARNLEATFQRTSLVAEDLKRKVQGLEAIGKRFSGAMTSALEGVILRGEKLDTVFKKLAVSLAKIALRAALKPLQDGFGKAVGSVLVGGAGAFRGSAMVPFARGGVLSSPALFPLGRGVGLAGEAGPEAILPLSRGPGGRLGVQASAGGNTTVNFSVNASDAESFMRSESQIAAMLNRVVSRGNRNL